MSLGYTKPLFILPFDHRASFVKKMFGWEGALTREQHNTVCQAKWIIYQGMVKSISDGAIPKEQAGVLVEEEFGDAVLRDATSHGFTTILTTEKSGQEEFEFDFGEDHFAEHIERYHPTFTKVLIRYNPEGDQSMNLRQQKRLKLLSDYSHEHGYNFLIEPLIPATAKQLEHFNGDKKRYDSELRPHLTVQMMAELQGAGIEPDVWKIEGMTNPQGYRDAVAQAQSGGRTDVSIIILGRGEDAHHVEQWIAAGAAVAGVIGFAIGRTIFWDAIAAWHGTTATESQAIDIISKNYIHFYRVFEDARAHGTH